MAQHYEYKRKPVSLYDIAVEAGVSTATVSNVLNHRGRYSDRTKAVVEHVAQQLGYVGTDATKRLGDLQTRTVGVITPDVSNDFFSSIVRGLETRLREHGYNTFVCNTDDRQELMEASVLDLIKRRVDGIVLVGGATSFPLELIRRRIPAVSIDRMDDAELQVNNDMRAMCADATNTLIRHGARHIAFLSVRRSIRPLSENARYLGYEDALSKAGYPIDTHLVLHQTKEHGSQQDAHDMLLSCLEKGYKIDGVVAQGDRVALGAVHALEEFGLTCGRDVLVMGADNSVYSKIVTPSISTIERHVGAMADNTVSLLVQAMKTGAVDRDGPVVIPHRVIERTTTLGQDETRA